MDFSDHGILVSGSTGHARTTCPQCSPTRKKHSEPCLSVDIDQGLWFCHHCAWSGSLKNGHKPDYIKQHFKRPEFKPSGLPQNVIGWFAKRGIPEWILTANSISYGTSFGKTKGIQFPYFKDGVAVNIKHRSHQKEFRQEKDAEKCLYRFDAIAQGGDCLIITEGEIDALSVQAAGFDKVTSIPDGAPTAGAKEYRTKFDFLNSAQTILDAYPKVVLATDSDAPGRAAEQELARRIGVEKCYRIEYPDGCKDANDVLIKYGKEQLIAVIEEAIPMPVDGLFSISEIRSDILDLYEKGEGRGLLTGWKTLDPFYTVRQGELTIVTGIPGSGKSEFIDALALNLNVAYGWRFAFCSPENWPPKLHARKWLEKAFERPFGKNGDHSRRMAPDEVEAGISMLSDSFFFIMPEEEALTVDTILDKTRVAIKRHGISGLIIDPWNELDHAIATGQREDLYISESLSKIRRFVRLNGIHAWIVAHPKNLRKDDQGCYKPPTMYEISGGAQWRNKADNGLCVHRPNFSVDETEIIIQKIRFKEVGRIGKVVLKYCRETGIYSNLDHRGYRGCTSTPN